MSTEAMIRGLQRQISTLNGIVRAFAYEKITEYIESYGSTKDFNKVKKILEDQLLDQGKYTSADFRNAVESTMTKIDEKREAGAFSLEAELLGRLMMHLFPRE